MIIEAEVELTVIHGSLERIQRPAQADARTHIDPRFLVQNAEHAPVPVRGPAQRVFRIPERRSTGGSVVAAATRVFSGSYSKVLKVVCA